MRRVYGVKVTRITRGDLPLSTGRNPGQGNLETGCLMFGRSQQKPYEPDQPPGKGLNTLERTGALNFDGARKGRSPGRDAGGRIGW